MARETGPVFYDPSGRRWSRMRRLTLAAGIATTLLALSVVVAILLPPALPPFPLGSTSPGWRPALPDLALSRLDRARAAARRRLFAQLRQHRPAPALRPGELPVSGRRAPAAPVRDAEVAGFYVNWDDNSFASFRAHAAEMDLVVGEWGFVAAGGDSLRLAVDRRVLFTADRLPAGQRPRALLMVSNFSSQDRRFETGALRRLLERRAARARAVAQLDSAVRRFGLGGVTVDFEEVPEDLHAPLARFLEELRAALPAGSLVTQAVAPGLPRAVLRAYAKRTDRIFLMLYDEHDGGMEPGPVASQRWYELEARRALEDVPAGHLILALGAYGYHWNDATPGPRGDEVTYQDVLRAAREHGAPLRWDAASLNPYLAWSDPDSTDHVMWFLDGATAWNEVHAGRRLGVAGHAIWRLGSEDPSVWNVLGRAGLDAPAAALATMPAGYDVEFEGEGELLRAEHRPTDGRRDVTVDSASGLVAAEAVTALPTPWVIQRTGASPHEVALTFDDGPDGQWTPVILDTLRKYGAPATFFVIGANVEKHIRLTRRLYAEGHEVGIHTFSHPNLALVPNVVTRLELDAAERVVEAVLDRRTALFRPPYFGDAEPTTVDELGPVAIATDLGYVTAGLHVDSDDWQQPGRDSIIRNVLARRAHGNVVLLHDSGGDRSQTVAALGPLIDSLRARGDTLVLLSQLAGLTRDQAMTPLPPASAATRAVELASFALVGGLEWGVHWLFLVAAVLAIGRLAVILTLALLQRFGRRVPAPAGWAPPVSVVVPAYNEERVIVKTVESLLAQAYAGPLEIVVVDDGSPDGTYAVAQAAFGGDPRVRVLTKPNGGKASALNHGIAAAQGEVIVALDADTVFAPGTIARLVAPLADPAVGAVAGNAKVGNRVNLVTRWQAVEYVTSQNLDRRAFAELNCITVVPGAVGAWRRALVLELGGFSDDTLAEDQDLTLAVLRRGYRVAYADDAVAWTEAPDTLRGLAKQRFRWSFGTLQCMWKHRDALFRRRYGALGWVAMPNVWLFQLVFAALSPLADLMFLWSLLSIWLVKEQHGATYALVNLQQVLTLYALFLVVDWGAAVLAFLLEPGEDWRLSALIVLQRFAYRQVMYFVVGRSFMAALRGRVVGWGKLERKATVALPGTS